MRLIRKTKLIFLTIIASISKQTSSLSLSIELVELVMIKIAKLECLCKDMEQSLNSDKLPYIVLSIGSDHLLV